MNVVRTSIEIRGHANAVFDLVTTARFWPQWHPASRAVGGVTQRPYQLGEAILERAEFGGAAIDVGWRVAEHVRPSRIVLQAETARARIVYALQPAAGGVLFTRELEYDEAPLRAVFPDPHKLHELMDQQSELSLKKLKALVEDILAAEARTPMRRYAILDEIRGLDPVADHQRIVHLSSCFDFPFDTTRALEFALFRTFCVPSISALLDRTGEFNRAAQKRYDDTDIMVSELLEWGYESARGSRALRRMNQLHGRFAIANDDFLYVLSTFIFEPIRWNERYGWRLMCETERLGYFHFWREVGRRMNIKDIFADYAVYEQFNRDYERRHYRFTQTNQRIGAATRELFVSWFPRAVAPLVRSAIYAMLEEPLLDAFGFPRPSRLMRRLVSGSLRLRAGLVRWLPPRRRPRLRTEMKHPTYPEGYTIEQLGPAGVPAESSPLQVPGKQH